MTDPISTYLDACRALIGLRGPALGSALCPAGIALGGDGTVLMGGDAVGRIVEQYSTCELACAAAIRAMLAALGLPVPDVDPYVDATAARVLEALVGYPWALGTARALRRADLATPPTVGVGLWWKGAPGHPEHVDAGVTGVSVVGDGHVLLISAIAGGQPDGAGHYSAIAEVSRSCAWNGRAFVDQGTGRELLCAISPEMMVASMLEGAS